MKTPSSMQTFHFIFLIWLILAGVLLSPAAGAAVDFEVLKSLGKGNGKPTGALIQDTAGNFYGNTEFGGSHGAGTVYKIDASGNYSVLHEFDGGAGGKSPVGRLLLASDGNLYGTTTEGGTGGGTVFKLSLSGTFSVLYTFNSDSGSGYTYTPSGSLIQGLDGSLYGAAGGGSSFGVVYKIDLSGNLTILHDFNSDDGIGPRGEVVQGSDGSLYGTTAGFQYDSQNLGFRTLFKIDPSGNFSVLHHFPELYVGQGSNPYEMEVVTYPTSMFQGVDGSVYGYGGNRVFRIEPSGSASILYESDSPTSPNITLLIQGSDGNFYGKARSSVSLDNQIVFKLDSSWNYSVLYEIDDSNDSAKSIVGLIQGVDGNLYATTEAGGSGNAGTVSKLDSLGNYSVLHEFEGSEGRYPQAGLIQGSDGSFYGTTFQGGGYGLGSVFKLDSSGTVSLVHSFGSSSESGVYPGYELIQGGDGSLYGTTGNGGTAGGAGTVFKLDPSGSFSVLHSFEYGNGGGYPSSKLVQGSDGSFYGTTNIGGSNDAGIVYRLASSGDFSVLHSFEQGSFYPGNLILGSDGNFYGTIYSGGSNNAGSIFKLDSSGNFSILHEFDPETDGSNPNALFQGVDGDLYGASPWGGSNNFGTVFKLDLSGNFSVLYEFGVMNSNVTYDHSNSLIQSSDGSFYGTYSYSLSQFSGPLEDRVFKLDASGNFSLLHEFGSDSEGRGLNGPLLQVSDGSLYGVTGVGGTYGGGVIYRLTETTQATTTLLTSSRNPSVVGQSVTFTATVSGNSPTGTVEFFIGSTSLGSRTLSNGVAALSTSKIVAGTHSITAVYNGDANNAPSTSAAVTQVVKAKTGTTLTSSRNPSTFRTAVTFTASVKGNAPTGSVTFLDGSVSLGTATLGSDGKAKLTTAALRRGTHKITASYAGDANNAASTSAPLTQTVR